MFGVVIFFFFQAEDGIRDYKVTGVQTCALPISLRLRALPVLGGGARRVTPLGSLAAFEPADSRLSLEREDQQQMIAMTADVSGRSLGGGMSDGRRGLGPRPGAPGVGGGLGGQ